MGPQHIVRGFTLRTRLSLPVGLLASASVSCLFPSPPLPRLPCVLCIAYPWARLTFWVCSSGYGSGGGFIKHCGAQSVKFGTGIQEWPTLQFSRAGSWDPQVLNYLTKKPTSGRRKLAKRQAFLPPSVRGWKPSRGCKTPLRTLEEKLSRSLLRYLQNGPRAKAQTSLCGGGTCPWSLVTLNQLYKKCEGVFFKQKLLWKTCLLDKWVPLQTTVTSTFPPCT